MPFGDPGPYPIPSGGTGSNGPPWLKLHIYQPAYAEVTDIHIYEDGGASRVLRNDEAPIRILIEYDGLEEADVAIIDEHRANAFGGAFGFSFTDPRTNTTYTDVHYDEEFEEDHTKTWINRRVIHLIKRPV